MFVIVACQCISNMYTISNVTVIPPTGNYVRSQGECRGGDSPADYAGREDQGKNRDSCETICDADMLCTGYMITVDSGDNRCFTYTSRNAVGDGNSALYCYMKSKSSQSTLYNTSPVSFTCFKSYSYPFQIYFTVFDVFLTCVCYSCMSEYFQSVYCV